MNVKDLHEQMIAHIKLDEEFQRTVDEKLDRILSNHLQHMEADLAILQVQVKSLVKVAWFIGLGFASMILTALGTLIFK